MRWPALVIGNCILIFLIQLVNNALATSTIHFCPYALFIFAPLILLPFTLGLFSVITTGLILDATTQLPPGTTTIILVVVYVACFWFRHQFKAYSGWHTMLVLQSANAIIFSFLSVFINTSSHTSAYYWGSVVLNLIFSQIVLLFITSWFLNLQSSLLKLFGSKIKDSGTENPIDNTTVETS